MRTTAKNALTIAMCVVLVLLCGTSLVACNSLFTKNPPKITPPTPTSYVSIDINPSVELILDQNGTVMSVSGANHDARVMLYQEDGIVGASVDVAVENLATLAVEYGYISKSDLVINVNVVSDDNGDERSLTSKIFDSFGNTLEKYGISAKLESEAEMSALYEIEQLKQRGIEIEEDVYRLANRVSKMFADVSFDEALTLSKQELIERINEAQSYVENKFDSDYSSKIAQAQYVYDSAIRILDDGVYIEYFVENLLQNPLSNARHAMYALEYLVANANRLALEYYSICQQLASSSPSYLLSSAEIKSFSALLGFDLNDIADSQTDGCVITMEDLATYADKLYRNADDVQKQRIKDGYAAVREVLDKLQNVAIRAFDFATDTIESTLDAVCDSLPSFIVAYIDDIRSDLSVSESDCASESAIAKRISELKKAAHDAYEAMELDEEDLKNIEAMKDKLKTDKDEASARLDNAIEQARKDAQALLEAEKNSRKYNK